MIFLGSLFKAISYQLWPAANKTYKIPNTFVAVMGLHRSGSSCLAMVINKLGVHLGNKLGGVENERGGGGEAQGLMNLCEKYLPFPSMEPKLCEMELRNRLMNWIKLRCREAISKNTIAGGKYPHLCVMGEHLDVICGDKLKIIVADRPIEESIASLQKREAGKNPEQLESLQRHLHEQREAYLAATTAPILRVGFAELLEDPGAVIREIIDFLEIQPIETQLEAAVSHPQEKHRTVKLSL